ELSGGLGGEGARAIEGDLQDEQKETNEKSDELLYRLESLATKNLLITRQRFDGTPRFFMLDTIQEYAQEQLETHGEQAAVQERFLHFFLKLVRTAEPHFYQPEMFNWVELLDNEGVNLRAALTWCKENSDSVQIGLKMAGALTLFWFHSGHLREGRTWQETMLARTSDTDRSHARAKTLWGVGFLSWKQNDVNISADYAEQALSIFREGVDTLWTGNAELLLAVVMMAQGKIEEARPLLEECLSIYKKTKSVWGEGFALLFLGIGARLQGKPGEALSYYEKSFQSVEQIHDLLHSSVLLCALADIVASQGDKEGGDSYYEEFQ